MKKILIIISFLNAFFVSAQSEDLSKPYTFTEVVNVTPNLTAKMLYTNAKIWFTTVYKDPREVLLLDDNENFILIGRGAIKYDSKIFIGFKAREGWITYDVKIMCKDGKYKYEFTNFYHKGVSHSLGLVTNELYLPTFTGAFGGSEKYKVKVTTELRAMIYLKITSLINNLKIAMDKPLPTQENW